MRKEELILWAHLTFEKYETIIYDASGMRRYTEYTPVKQNECKKHEIDPMETGTSKAHTNSESFLYNEDNTKNNF